MNYEFFLTPENQVVTIGIWFEADITCLPKVGKYQIWYIPARTVRMAIAQRGTEPSELLLIEVLDENYHFKEYARLINRPVYRNVTTSLGKEIDRVEPGYQWRKARAELIEKANRLVV